MSFFSHAVSAKLGNNNRLTKLNALLDWSKIEKHLSKIYEGKRKEVGGVKPYNALSMYKAILLQAWHSLSDPQLEEALRVRIDFMEFTGFTLETHAPDETTFCRFRNRLVELELDQILMNEINNQLSFSGLKIEKSNGAVIDATIVESAARPKQQMGPLQSRLFYNFRSFSEQIRDCELKISFFGDLSTLFYFLI